MVSNAIPRPQQRQGDGKTFTVSAPSPYAGFTDALRTSYRASDIPADFLKLLGRLK